MRVSILGDQLGKGAGGGRFITGLLQTLLSDCDSLKKIKKLYVLLTEKQKTSYLGSFPSNVSVIRRRFPSRLRQTPFAILFGYTLPSVDVAFGPFYYTFPCRARVRIVTMHDLTCFDNRFHPMNKVRNTGALLTKMAHDCDGVVCDSDDVLSGFQNRWPSLAHKAVRIYLGVARDATQSPMLYPVRENSILAVGTIEPRKNYPILLDAFECLVSEQGDDAPVLTVVGNIGWMSEQVEQRLLALQAIGKCRWLRNASDKELSNAYAKASIFTYLSLSEGFGYPPFEAAHANCPMVLSKASSVGEIWSNYAKCVDPLDISEIITGWKWALALTPPQREVVITCQKKRAGEFTWSRALNDYLAFWDLTMSKKNEVRVK